MSSQSLLRGTIAVISVDPVASVAAFQDEEATRQASKLPRGKYLAFANTFFGFDWSRPGYDQPLALSFVCIGRGLPEPPSASIRLSPNAPAGNDRPPLVITPSLPWEDCCVYTLKCFYAEVARVYPCIPPSIPTILTSDQRAVVGETVISDQMTEKLPLRDVYGNAVQMPAVATKEDGSPEFDPSVYDLESCFLDKKSAQGEAVADDPAPTKTNVLNEAADDDSASESVDPHRGWPRIDVWLDLTSAPTVDDPEELMRTIRQLTIIEHEAKGRGVLKSLADQPRTAQWAQDVASADAPDPAERPAYGNRSEASEDDGSVMPEDAIEHRSGHESVKNHSRPDPASAAPVAAGSPEKGPKLFSRLLAGIRFLVRRLDGKVLLRRQKASKHRVE